MNTYANGSVVNEIDTTSAVSLDDLSVHGREWTRLCVEVGGAAQAWFATVSDDHQINWISSWPENAESVLLGTDIQEKIVKERKRAVFISYEKLISAGIFPILDKSRTVGLLALHSSDVDLFTSSTIRWIDTLAESISVTLAQIEKSTRWEKALHLNNRILQSSFQSKDHLSSMLAELSDNVDADAIFVYRQVKKRTNHYELYCSYGFESPDFKLLPLFAGPGLTGQDKAITALGYENLEEKRGEQRLNLLIQQGFKTYLSCPLMIGEKMYGILELVWRSAQEDQKNFDLINITTGALSWRLAYSALTNDLAQYNQELTKTHTATLEGLTRALELRDLETEGHTQRVCDLTLQLATHIGVPKNQMAFLFQGALLHDIGKLGVPDAILLKPGSLTEKEWQIMKQHPQHAYNILAPIVRLEKILDIPLYHHERWNGSGYPFGIKDMQIPLFARLFAVIDVFDALTSDRPYRAAWSRSQAVEYINKNAGKLFDPEIVVKFIDYMGTGLLH
jgi:response regulator RpfG family c-di-GMP phosphodiesterase